MTDREARRVRRAQVRDAAVGQGGVLVRSQLAKLGVSADAVDAEVAAGRWFVESGGLVRIGGAGVVHPEAASWVGVLAAAPKSMETPRAALGGLSALKVAGLTGVAGDGLFHVAAPKSSRPLPLPAGYRLHETRRWRDEDVLTAGIWRFRPPVAAIQAALWARTDREAALMLCSPVQQRLAPVEDVAAALERVRRDRRRRLLRGIVGELVGGSQSVGELDLIRLCRGAGLPVPDRQAVHRRPGGGSYYLDARWDRWGVVAEVDGVGHLMVDRWLADCARHNEIAIGDELVLRLPTLGLRLEPEVHLAVVRRALTARGWTP